MNNTTMNNHLLPFPYNQALSPTWLGRLNYSISNVLTKPEHPKPRRPSTMPINVHGQNSLPPIRIICISDTHNAIPSLPPGDIMIHAGDLTTHGTLAEVQAQLQWLSSQAHTHKIVIAGNHDTLLDEASDTKFATRSGDSVVE